MIADELGITEDGVKAHIRRLFEKYGATNRASLVRAAAGGEDVQQTSLSSLLDALVGSLQEVIGATAARGLVRRALKRALDRDGGPNLRESLGERGQRGHWPDATGDVAVAAFSAIARELWPLLIETSGQILVQRLERGGLRTDSMQPGEVLVWARR